MINFSEEFPHALKDYDFFLRKSYPQKALLKLVGDHYKLSGTERAMLYRGITTRMKSKLRQGKRIKGDQLKGQMIYVDTFNQLVTIGSYLYGRGVFICNDGFVRDASDLHGRAVEFLLPLQAVELMMAFLVKTGIAGAVFYLDRQVDGSNLFMGKLEILLKDFELDTEIIVSEKVDKDLIHKTEGVICSSDSTIIDRAGVSTFDLAKATLEYHFWPKFSI